ncbi:sulfur carrier protein ThiS [Coxiella endosymbiont of Amblyomma americanum]|uniref:sulfur carrier protein ThiS n=1 Tax=Coxiella endosymbiont of Amblyomma americanum TaxID=325775 RepID=UPI00057CF117|nr:sulfur carrier protein ThiS [Coxiella endosymbiont of Amblyomma americanum]AJC50472.1 thiamine biosynthesis protein ThiS [Coxiella endosymbiont of Amblyomma americanum]AUJ58812.1 thiamine biosynthesis protein ThiS [Coxiella-like endosymbiont of Amblyomma americanum]
MPNIYLNGELVTIQPHTTLKQLLSEKNFSGVFAVAINEVVINMTNYEKTIIHSGDRVEIITAIYGG